MGDCAAREGIVGVQGCVQVRHDVDMVGTASVVARNEGVECDNADIIRRLHTTHEGCVEVGGVIGVAVAASADTGVHTSRVARPDLEVRLRDGLTGVNIDDLYVQGHWYALLTLGDVLSDKFAGNPVWTLGCLGCQYARVVARKEDGGIDIWGDASQVALVIGVEDSLSVASAKERLVYSSHQLPFTETDRVRMTNLG